MSPKNLNVYLADDHEIVAKAIANLLTSVKGVESVKTFSDGESLYKACSVKLPGLIILDMEMPGWNGITTLKRIKENYEVPVIILSMNDERSVIEEAIKAGARGYLNKNCTPAELQNALETVLSGSIFLSGEIQKVMVGLKQSATESKVLTEPLTEKEYEVLKLVCEGFSSKEIGERLFLSPRTIETRKENLMQKFNVQTTGKLIAFAIKNKIIK